MSVGPLPVASIIQRLSDRVSIARVVGTAGDLDTALESPPNATPALYVISDERGGHEKYTGSPVIQNVDVQVKVVRLVRNVSGERLGTGARKVADELIKQIRQALVGWTPDDAFDPLTFLAGRDDRYRAGGWLAGQEIFRTSYRLMNQVQP